jgi:hypothetical protein
VRVGFPREMNGESCCQLWASRELGSKIPDTTREHVLDQRVTIRLLWLRGVSDKVTVI